MDILAADANELHYEYKGDLTSVKRYCKSFASGLGAVAAERRAFDMSKFSERFKYSETSFL